jgi:hypothetical protein
LRALAATRKRHAHLKAAAMNATGTEFQNALRIGFQNDDGGPISAAK